MTHERIPDEEIRVLSLAVLNEEIATVTAAIESVSDPHERHQLVEYLGMLISERERWHGPMPRTRVPK